MLIDFVKVNLKAGNGGNGAVSFIRNGQTSKGGPDGGNGGNGGNVFLQGSTNINDLKEFRFKKKIRGIDGIPGGRNNLYGKNAEHSTILLPIGTQVTDTKTNQTFEVRDNVPILIARGGVGGRGNNEFKSATRQAPKFAEPGGEGEEKDLIFELKIIADAGLAGLPNAGKSSLLAMLTNATPRVGDYPFTTLEPNIGMLEDITLADIPGLIEGASTGKGLGIRFLKHIEKTKIILHCIDSTEENVEEVYKIVRGEFQKYNPELLEKPEIIIFTKKDLATPEKLKENKKIFAKKKLETLEVSIYDEASIEKLKEIIKKFTGGN
ncbi:MAG: GTPase ObgE [Candidatus Levybacteria bacterium]|nr:GTPase ObgE [Candidatus Levybacteria bacterium]